MKIADNSTLIKKIKNFKIYTDERFPVVKNSIFVLIFVFSAYIFSGLVFTGGFAGMEVPLVKGYTVAGIFIIVFLIFFQLRISDEFKDYEEDLKYRSYRPVQRGIISLKELRNIGIVTIIIQLTLSFIINFKMIFLLVAVWIYMFLMAKEFFVKEWLKSRMVLYALSHVVIMVLIAFIPVYGMLNDFNESSVLASYGNGNPSIFFEWKLWSFYLISYLNGIVLEIGRKTRREDEEEFGVETYSKMWGKKKASYILSGLYMAEYILVLSGLFQLLDKDMFFISASILTLILLITIYFTVTFFKRNLSGKIVETFSGIWIISSYIMSGILQYIIFLIF